MQAHVDRGHYSPRGALFPREYCPGGHYSLGTIFPPTPCLQRNCVGQESLMPFSCCAVGCTQRCSKARGVKVYRFPIELRKEKGLEACWMAAQHLFKDVVLISYQVCCSMNQLLSMDYVCSISFFIGKPSSCPTNPDYVPSIFSFNERVRQANNHQKLQRYERFRKRQNQGSTEGLSPTDNDKVDIELCVVECEGS